MTRSRTGILYLVPRTHTTLVFKRLFKSCDESQDLEVTDSMLNIVWAYDYDDSIDELTVSKHYRKGSIDMQLIQPMVWNVPQETNLQVLDFMVANVCLNYHQ